VNGKLLSSALAILSQALTAVSASIASAADDARPNIVLIMADDLGYECVGVNGGRSYKTPHLDALAAGGVRFTHCYSTPLCTPSRVQMLTGKYNFRNYTEFAHLDLRQTTFADLLKRAGYRTCIAGKWQLAGDEQAPHQIGFDEYCLWQAAGRRGSRYADPVIIENGTWRNDTRGKYGPDILCDYLLDFIGRHHDKPFLAYYPMVLPHAPHEPTPASKPGDSEQQNFADMVAYLDRNVGRIVQRLDDLKLSERTIVIFTGDNGTNRRIRSQFGDRIARGGKGTPTIAGTHVPLIARWQGISPAGAVNEDLIDFTDILPTLCEAAGLPLTREETFDGTSFLPHIRGLPGRPRSWVYCYYDPRHGNNFSKAVYAHDKRWKLYDDGRFFDLLKDPEENNPIVIHPSDSISAAAQAARRRLQAVLDRMAKDADNARALKVR
jgi:arylsulfatase A